MQVGPQNGGHGAFFPLGLHRFYKILLIYLIFLIANLSIVFGVASDNFLWVFKTKSGVSKHMDHGVCLMHYGGY